MAWLHAVPKPPEGSKRAKLKGQAAEISRLDRLKRDGVKPSMPPNPLPHTILRLVEMGITEAAGMGAAPLSWITIDAWQRTTGVELAAWEARLIRKLSIEYLGESRRAESETCPPPWRSEVSQQERDAEDATLRSILG
jgi:hypothetical protein